MAALLGWLSLEGLNSRQALTEAPYGVPFTSGHQPAKPITEQAFRNRPTALFFGFTHCPEICPTTVYELTGWLDEVDPDAKGLQAYFVSIDPARDTPELLGTYLSNVTKRIIGISGDPAKVEEMARGFKIYFKKVPTDADKPDGEYTMDHTASIFLLDRGGRFVGTIAYGEDGEVAKQKLKNLMKR
jgi:protein SCO1/2